MKIRLDMTSPVFHLVFSDTIKNWSFFVFFFWGGGLKLRSVEGRETVQKHVLLFCFTEIRKASTALTLANPSRCRLSMFPRWTRTPPPPNHFIIYGFILIFNLFLCFAKSKNKNTSFRDLYLNYNFIYFKFLKNSC